MNIFDDVRAFHTKFGCTTRSWPGIPGHEVVNLREDLIREELDELSDACDDENLPQIAKECADLIYVTVGLALAYGIDLGPVWKLVHDSNMDKVGGEKRDDGKILKPNGWKSPDITAEIQRQMP